MLPSSLTQWVLAAVRLALLATFLIALHESLRDNLLAALSLGGVWSVLLLQTLQTSTTTDQSVLDRQLLTLLVGVRTLNVLSQHSVAETDGAWALPLALAVVHTYLTHEPVLEGPVEYPRLTPWFLAAVGVATGVSTVSQATDLRLLLGVLEVVLGAGLFFGLLAYKAKPEDGWDGGSTVVLSWCTVQLAGLLVDPQPVFVATGVVVVAAGSVVGVNGLFRLPRAAVNLLGRVLGQTAPYQITLLLCVAVIVQSLRQPWYTTHVDYPEVLRKKCRILLDIVDVAQAFYEFTSDPDFQNTLLLALPELGALRGAAFRSIRPSYPVLMGCVHGKTMTFSPGGDVSALALLVPMVWVALATVLQVFPDGGALVRNRFFWAAGAVAGLTFTAVTQLTADAPVMFWYHLFADSTSERVYTEVGQYGLVASLAFTVSCIALFVITSQVPTEETRLVERALGKEPDRSVVVVDLLNYVTSPSFVLLVVAGFVLVLTITSTGSPIDTFEVYKKASEQPAWLVSTPADKVSGLGLTKILGMLNPKKRLIVIGVALAKYALEKMGTWACICLPIPNWNSITGAFEDAGDAISGFFSRRRRLLEHKAASTHLGTRSMASRRLLSHGGCSQTEICVSDVVKTIVDELTSLALQGLEIASDLVSKVIRKLIPFADKIDDLLEQLPRVDELLDFDLLDLPDLKVDFSFRLELLGLDLGVLPSFRLPTLPSAQSVLIPVAVLAALGCVLAYQLGVLMPLLNSTRLSIELALLSCVVAFANALMVFVYLLRDQLRAEGYDVRVTFKGNVYGYGVGIGLVVASVLLAGGEGSARFLSLLRERSKDQAPLLARRTPSNQT